MTEDNKNFLKFRNILKFVFENEFSDFYKIKYKKAGFNPLSDFNSIDDIKKIPLLSREELSSAEPSKLLFVGKENVDSVFTSSGTSGDPFFTFCSSPQSSSFPDPLKEIDFGKCLFLSNPIRAYNIASLWRKRGNLVLMGDIHNIPASLQLASNLKINTIHTTATLAIILKDYLERYPDLKKSLKFFWLGGELVSPFKKRVLQELYPTLKIFLSYGISEAGKKEGLAFQCPSLAKRSDQIYYHLQLSDYYFEIVNQEAESEKKGELVVTNFWNLVTPIIRYKTGDLIGFTKNDCPCGSPGPLLQIWGRINHDIVRAGGFELRTEMAEKPILNLRDYLEDNFEVHIYENFVGSKPKIRMALNLSLKEGVEESSGLKQRVENEFLENWRLSPALNLRKAVEAGLFEFPQINFVKFPLSQKARRVLILH